MKEIEIIDGATIHLEDYRKVSKNSGNVTCEMVLHQDNDTNMMVKRMIYKKGSVTPWHSHPCGHGIYVLRGTLVTNKGNYGPNSLVWWNEGARGYHGAENEDVEVIFITNKEFSIHYYEEEELLDSEDRKYLIHRPQ